MAKLKNELNPAGKNSTASDGEAEAFSSEDSEADEFIDDLPVAMKNNASTGPRMSVSAEVFGKFNIEQEYKPPVHAKSEEQKEAIRNRMKENFMFASLNPKDKKSIIDAIVPVKKSKGDSIITQGDDGDNFYLVEHGELTCSKRFNPSDAEDTFLKTYVAGESFGELALLYNAPRAATIVCKSDDCLLWSLERATFNSIIKTAVQKKRAKYDTFLERVEILSCMDKYERAKLADAFREEWFEEGDYIIKQGDKDDAGSFYMIIEGHCIATMVMQPGTAAVEVKSYGPGDYFGERSLLRDLPRAANIVASD